MSLTLVIDILNGTRVSGLARLVLLQLAFRANEKGIAWPSIETLSKETGVSKRHLKRIIPVLERSGEFVVNRSTGRTHSNQYLFPPSKIRDVRSPIRDENGVGKASFKQGKGDMVSRKSDVEAQERTINKRKSNLPSKFLNKRQRLGNGVVL